MFSFAKKILRHVNITGIHFFILKRLSIARETIANTMANTIRRCFRVAIALVLCPFLSKGLNIWTTWLFTEFLAVETQIHLAELLGLEKLNYWIIGSLALSLFFCDRVLALLLSIFFHRA